MQKFTVGYCEMIITKSDIYITSSNNSEVETKNTKARNFRGNSILWIWHGTGLQLVKWQPWLPAQYPHKAGPSTLSLCNSKGLMSPTLNWGTLHMIGPGRASFTSFTGVATACVPINNPQLMLMQETVSKLNGPLKKWERPCWKE